MSNKDAIRARRVLGGAYAKTFDAFGNVESSSGTPVGPFGFAGGAGYQADADSGLMLLGHRYYDSSTGRFLTRDPAEDGRNWYVYCGSNPLRWVDADGRNPGDRFPTPQAAVHDAAGHFAGGRHDPCHPEWGGWVYPLPGGGYSYSAHTSHSIVQVYLGPRPPGTVSSWHTHPIAGLPYPGKPGYITGRPNSTDPVDQSVFRSTPGPDYVIQPGGGIQKYK